MIDHLADLRAQYIANYYAQKIQKIDNKEEAKEMTERILDDLINDPEFLSLYKKKS